MTHVVVMYSQTSKPREFVSSQLHKCLLHKKVAIVLHLVSAARCAGDSLHSGRLDFGYEVPHGSLRGVPGTAAFL